MTRPTKLLVVGIIGGIVVAAIGAVGAWRAQADVTRLTVLCEQQDRKPKADDPVGFKLICDPRDLDVLDLKARRRYEDALGTGQVVEYTPSPGVQGQLVTAQRRLLWWQSTPKKIAIAVIVLMSLPWMWYFLLDRVQEVSKAIQGRRTT